MATQWAGPDDPFAEEFAALWTAAGNPTLQAVAAAANKVRRLPTRRLTVQRLSDWRRGRHRPATFDTLRPVLVVLIAAIRQTGSRTSLRPELASLEYWRELFAGTDSDVDEPRPEAGDRSPYKGLAPYGVADGQLFRGRDSSLAELVGLIDEVAGQREPTCRVVSVVGPSGAGKTSLLAAGLIGRRALGQRWDHVLVTPGPNPLAALGVALEQARTRSKPDLGRVVVIDQFEQLFTRCCREAERRAFIDAVEDLARSGPGRPRVVVVVVIRSDVVDECLRYPVLAETVKSRTMVLSAMSDAELREVIVGPARDRGWRVEPGLVDLMVRDLQGSTDVAGRAGRLALLSQALGEIARRRAGGTLTVAGYREVGGIAGAMVREAESTWARLDSPSRASARRLLWAMLHHHPAGCVVVPASRLDVVVDSPEPRQMVATLEELVSSRLIIVGDSTVELIHEALLDAWPRLARWLAVDRQDALIRQRVIDDARAWAASGHDSDFLYRGRRLSEARLAMDHEAPEWPGQVVARFLTASAVQCVPFDEPSTRGGVQGEGLRGQDRLQLR